jgi:hypothetical protein
MWYVNKCSTVCTQRGSPQLEKVQAQVSHVTQSSKSSKMAEKCDDKPLCRLNIKIECKEKKGVCVTLTRKDRESLVNMTARKEKMVERKNFKYRLKKQ